MTKPLKKIVAEFLQSSDQSSHAFWRCYMLAQRGLENEFNIDITGSFKTALVNVNPNKTVVLPEDCISFSKIGIINSRGEIVTLKLNNQLTSYHGIYYNQTTRTQGLPLLNTFDVSQGIPTGQPYFYPSYYLNFYNGTSFNLFGIASGTGTVGTYRVDVQNDLILLDANFGYSQLLIEYLCDGFDSETDDYQIPIEAAEAMLCWIRWQNMIDKPKKFLRFAIIELANAKKDYFSEKRKAKVRLNKANIGDMQTAERESWTLTAKA